MTIQIKKEIDRSVLEDIFVTALEGGSNYWYYLSDEACRKIREAVPKSEDPYLSTAIVKAILDHDIAVPVNDAEDEELVVGFIEKKTMADRLQLLSDSEHSWALEAQISGDGDADSADIVFQYLTMGEVVYG
jgi:hypothetical protein